MIYNLEFLPYALVWRKKEREKYMAGEHMTLEQLLRAKCELVCDDFLRAAPDSGFFKQAGFFEFYYLGRLAHREEHWWLENEEGVILDFASQQWIISPGFSVAYKKFDPLTDEVYLGKCPNCGTAHYGIPEGPNSSQFNGYCDDACAESYGAYVTNSARRL